METEYTLKPQEDRPEIVDYLINKYRKTNPKMTEKEAMAKALDTMTVIPDILDHIDDMQVEVYRSLGLPAQKVILTDVCTNATFDGKLHKFPTVPLKVGEKRKINKRRMLNELRDENVYIYVNILQSAELAPNIKLPPLNAFDKEVFHAVLSMYKGGNEFISYEQVARFLTKLTVNQSKILIEDIAESMRKLISFNVYINLKEEAIAYNIPMPKRTLNHVKSKDIPPGSQLEGCMIGRILPGTFCEVRLNGTITGGIKMDSESVLYRYVLWKASGGRNAQLLTADVDALKDSPIRRKNKRSITLENYFFDRIAMMKKRNVSRTIRIETLMEKLDTLSADDKYDGLTEQQIRTKMYNEKRTLVNQAKKILDKWTEEKFIDGYDVVRKEEEKEGYNNTLYSFVIKVENEEKNYHKKKK